MLVIHCPFCGPRNESEFMHGGQSKSKRPESADDLSETEWLNHLIIPANPVGNIEEKWWHVRGCGQWVNVTRHTVTHEINLPSDNGIKPSIQSADKGFADND